MVIGAVMTNCDCAFSVVHTVYAVSYTLHAQQHCCRSSIDCTVFSFIHSSIQR